MISSYRLGDLIFVGLKGSDYDEILLNHPNSIGSKLILELRKDISKNNLNYRLKLIQDIIMNTIEEKMDCLPKDIEESTVIHLRLGDVIGGNQWHEKLKRPLAVDHIKSLVIDNKRPKYVIGKCFFAKPSSTNYEECIKLSNEYLEKILHELDAQHFDSGDADIDLCCGVKSKLFIQGRGFFSKLIVEIRKKLKLESIETTPHD